MSGTNDGEADTRDAARAARAEGASSAEIRAGRKRLAEQDRRPRHAA